MIGIRDQCLAAEVPFFFKQWGGVNKKRTGRMLEGTACDGFPVEPNLKLGYELVGTG